MSRLMLFLVEDPYAAIAITVACIVDRSNERNERG